jgi:DNA-binding response OmpR family regulator
MTAVGSRPLAGKVVLVVEDEYAVAALVQDTLERQGAMVLGPAATIDAALALVTESPDVAVLDVNVGGSAVFPVAAALESAGVPFLFSTGYGRATIPTRYAHVARLRKPFLMAELVAGLTTAIGLAGI